MLTKLKNFKKPHWLWLYTAALLCFALVVNTAMYLPIPTLKSLSSDGWLGFWGGYLGGAIGCLPAIAALKEGHEESKRQNEEREKDRRLSIMPVFRFELSPSPIIPAPSMKKEPQAIYFSEEVGFPDELNVMFYNVQPSYNLTIKNLGFGHAVNVSLSDERTHTTYDLGIFEKGERQILTLTHFSPKPSVPKPGFTYKFSLFYEDVFLNRYAQTVLYTRSSIYNKQSFQTVGIPKLIENTAADND